MNLLDIITTGAMLAAPVVSLLMTAGRLLSDRDRHRLLRTAATLPAGSRFEEHRADGTRLVLAIGGETP